jgi:hypothetical protein
VEVPGFRSYVEYSSTKAAQSNPLSIRAAVEPSRGVVKAYPPPGRTITAG